MSNLETIVDLAPRLRRREISPLELARACLVRIEKLNPTLNAFITVTAESALAEARAAEIEIGRGEWRGPLHGIPIALKDLIDTAGTRTTAASALYKDHVPVEDAEVVRRLKQAGAVIVGKNNLHEFAYGGSSLVGFFGDVHNPRATGHIAGGSSGGSAAAVAAGVWCAAMGPKTAGSIREPAALCGCVGFKPTYGRVSSSGIIPLSRSLDHVGPLARTVGDAAAVLEAIAGYDPADLTTSDVPVSDYVSAAAESPNRVRVGVPRSHFYDNLDPEVAAAVEQALLVIQTLVTEVNEIQLPVEEDRTLQKAESYAYHAENAATTPELYQPETLRRILSGAKVSALDYMQRRRELEEARRGIDEIFATVDLIVTPTTPMPAPSIAELRTNP